jgi:DNA-binding response OmpR family regulator
VLTVRNSDKAIIEALDGGADDCVTKPFSIKELTARIRVVLRRVPATRDAHGAVVKLDGIQINLPKRKLVVSGPAHAQGVRSTSISGR